MKSSELNLLSNHCDLFIVQSSAESGWIRSQDSKNQTSLAEKIFQLANGVDDIFFDVPTTKTARTCTFAGVVVGEYLQRVEWLVDKVRAPIQARYPDAKFTVSGSCSAQRMLEKFEQAQIVHCSFVEDPRDVFADQQVLLAPIFKRYGLIYKVVQSMAAGTLVIGDATAFNAIPEFEAGRRGLVAGSRGELAELLTQVFFDPEKTRGIQRAARTLIHKHFQWEVRFRDLRKNLLQSRENVQSTNSHGCRHEP